MTRLEAIWSNFCFELLMSKPDSYIQIRKMFQHKTLMIPWEDFQSGIDIGCERMGYATDASKMGQLRRNYFNQEQLELAREKFKERLGSRGNKSLQSCITARMSAEGKDSRSQGHCIQCVTINYLVDNLTKEEKFYIDLYYRTTEVTQKFLADLKFLHTIIFPVLLEGVDKIPIAIRFNFSTVYLSTMFMPIVFQIIPPLLILREAEVRDPRFFKLLLTATAKWLEESTNYNYRTRVKSHEVFRKYVIPTLSRRDLKELKKFVADRRK